MISRSHEQFACAAAGSRSVRLWSFRCTLVVQSARRPYSSLLDSLPDKGRSFECETATELANIVGKNYMREQPSFLGLAIR
jgi:hypothetical protein